MAAMAIDDARKALSNGGEPGRVRLDAINICRSTGMSLRQASDAVDHALRLHLKP